MKKDNKKSKKVKFIKKKFRGTKKEFLDMVKKTLNLLLENDVNYLLKCY
jgi:hypothetical protein